ncbi:MAG: dihydrodipicolinate synthase family protein [Acidimicrobiia bacterium]|nr:dihydrodipicolinate synthase family protein [Acidimicrobiia bacterium]
MQERRAGGGRGSAPSRMNPMVLPAGVYAPVPTPFDTQDTFDPLRFRVALARWVASPLAGLVVLGSNGEAPLVDEEESDGVIAVAREAIPPGRPLIVGTGRESTRATVAASRRAAALGADAVIVRTPGFFKSQMTSDVFVRHYTAVADASPVPVLLYNFTAVTGVNIGADAVARLAQHPNVVGIKESGGDVAQIAELVAAGGSAFRVFAGSSTSFYASLCVGAAGGILALGCVLPDACAALFDLVRQGAHHDARALQSRLVPLAQLLGNRYGVAGLKAALALVGCDVGPPRPPLVALDAHGRDAVERALRTFSHWPLLNEA